MTGAARYIHPSNGVTYLSILAGLLAIVAAREARSWSLAGALIAISAAADTLDGRFAGVDQLRPRRRWNSIATSLRSFITTARSATGQESPRRSVCFLMKM